MFGIAMNAMSFDATLLDAQGFCLIPQFLDDTQLDTISEWIFQLSHSKRGDPVSNKASGSHRRGGLRQLLERVPQLQEFVRSPGVRTLVEPVLGPSARVVRAILFDKTPAANWVVPWHQDLTIAVREQLDLPGYGPWTQKDAVSHVQPPTDILQSMLALRIHLDDCGDANGALRVIPGSHTYGKLDQHSIHGLVASRAYLTCAVPRGGAMLMRPLLLHASSKAEVPHRRRVIHLEFAAAALPGGLRWHQES